MTKETQRRERVVRLLNLVAYASKHPGLTPMEIARDLGSDPAQVYEDLDLLFLSGVGKAPGELFDLDHSWKSVTILDDQGMDKPLRLTPTEANALLVLLDSFETMPGLVDSRVVTSAAAKIRAATKARGVDGAAHAADTGVAGVVADALSLRRQLAISYYSAYSDATSERTVEPLSLFHEGGMTYLRALDGGEVKSFRMDRILTATLSDDPVTSSSGTAAAFDPADPFGLAGREEAELRIHPEATWLADYWEMDLEESGHGEWARVTMRYGSADWLVRFCLGQADRVRLIAPSHLAEEVRARATRAADALD